jgi:hypothetical protein
MGSRRKAPWFSVALSALTAFGAAACAREAPPPEFAGTTLVSERANPNPWLRASAPLPLPHRSRTRGLASLAIPDGDACLAWLDEHAVAYRVLDPMPGVHTPVSVTGRLGGVRYESEGKTSLVCDCRLAVALDWVSPELRSMGVSEVRHFGAYAYRTTKTGRPSLHALGLAIDVHELRIGGRNFDVERDYERGIGKSCSADSPTLNRLACTLQKSGFFQEVLTPDDDRDHRNHLHLAIAPL